MASGSDVTLATVLLAEYERIKDEQRARIGVRDNFVYATLASVVAVLAATYHDDYRPGFLLFFPPVATLLGWTYLINDQKISAMGRYIRDTLTPRLDALTGGSGHVFSWENDHRHDARRTSRKRLQLAVDLLLFAIGPVAAVVAYLVSDSLSVVLVGVAAVEIIGAVVLCVQIIVYADLH